MRIRLLYRYKRMELEVMDKQIGQRLREMRLKATLSQAKVAAVVGSRQSAVARFESGEAHVPADVMVGYADYFDVSLDYIFGRTIPTAHVTRAR